MSAQEVADTLRCSLTRYNRVETGKGRATLTAEEVKALCELYGVTDERHIQALLDMLKSSQEQGWWERYRSVLPPGLDTLVGLEVEASGERAWEGVLVHGLLQTADYAREVISAAPEIRAADVEALVELRMERQKVLTRSESPLDFWLILDEAVLRRPVGGPRVMEAQLRHLLAASEMPNVTVQVTPLHEGAHPGVGGPFSILDFGEDSLSPVVYVDSPAGNLYEEKPSTVRRFAGTYDLLRATALDPEESAALLHRAAKEMRDE